MTEKPIFSQADSANLILQRIERARREREQQRRESLRVRATVTHGIVDTPDMVRTKDQRAGNTADSEAKVKRNRALKIGSLLAATTAAIVLAVERQPVVHAVRGFDAKAAHVLNLDKVTDIFDSITGTDASKHDDGDSGQNPQ